MSGSALITTIRLRAARQNDTVLITSAFTLNALNEAQLHIVRKVPRLSALDKSDIANYRIGRWSTDEVDATVVVRASTGVVTLTAAGHGLAAGDIATVADVANEANDPDTAFNGNFEILSVASNDVTYFQNLAADNGVGATFGTIVKLAATPIYNIGDLAAAHTGGIWILNGASTRRAGLKYRELSDFRARYMPVAEQSPGEPTEYTRLGANIIFNRPVSRDYQGLRLKIDYTAWATDLADGATVSELPNSNKGLILFALAEIYDEIAFAQPRFESKALKTRILFSQWLDEYSDYQEMLIEELDE